MAVGVGARHVGRGGGDMAGRGEGEFGDKQRVGKEGFRVKDLASKREWRWMEEGPEGFRV